MKRQKENLKEKLSLNKEKIIVLNNLNLNKLIGGNAGGNAGGSKGQPAHTVTCTAY